MAGFKPHIHKGQKSAQPQTHRNLMQIMHNVNIMNKTNHVQQT